LIKYVNKIPLNPKIRNIASNKKQQNKQNQKQGKQIKNDRNKPKDNENTGEKKRCQTLSTKMAAYKAIPLPLIYNEMIYIVCHSIVMITTSLSGIATTHTTLSTFSVQIMQQPQIKKNFFSQHFIRICMNMSQTFICPICCKAL
jgi:hypothetical protein